MRSVFISLSILLTLTIGRPLHSREWTRNDGQQVKADLISISGNTIKVKVESGQTYDIDITTLIEADQEYVKSLNKEGAKKVEIAQFSPEPIEFIATDWVNPDNDSNWQLSSSSRLTRKANLVSSSFQYKKIIPSSFKCNVTIKLLELKKSNGRGVRITDSDDRTILITLGDDSSLGIFNSQKSAYEATSSELILKDQASYEMGFEINKHRVKTKVNEITLAAKWQSKPPYRISFFCQRSGMEASNLSIMQQAEIASPAISNGQEKSGVANKVSFFSIPIESTISVEPEQESTEPSKPDVALVENQLLAGTQWVGESPFRAAKGQRAKITFESDSRLLWTPEDPDNAYHMNYQKTEDGYRINRRFPLIFERQGNSLLIYVKTKGKTKLKRKL